RLCLGSYVTFIEATPYAFLSGTVEQLYVIEISFAHWMLFGVPFAWIFIFIVWFYLVKIAFPQELKELPGGKAVIQDEKEKLGSSSFEEKAVFLVFILAAIAWITRIFFLDK